MAETDDTTPDEPPVEEPPADSPPLEEPPAEEPAPDAPPPAAEPPAEEPASETLPPREPTLDDLASQLKAIPIGSFLISTVSTLASIAYGKLDASQLDDARGAIDAIGALMPVLEGRIEPALKRDLEQALANLRLAYADASAQGPS